MAEILALGDCNTAGVSDLYAQSYPELFAKKIGKNVKNCGYTMSTTREMIHFFNNNFTKDTEIILIQYGLVDSWKTFKYSPYVLYYPDTTARKFFRKLVKKYKKICKKLGLNELFGVKNVVDLDEYKKNIEYVIEKAIGCKIFLIDTIPNQETFRNNEIQKYNEIMKILSLKYQNVFKVNTYYDFEGQKKFYLDETHMNAEGIKLITDNILTVYVDTISLQ